MKKQFFSIVMLCVCAQAFASESDMTPSTVLNNDVTTVVVTDLENKVVGLEGMNVALLNRLADKVQETEEMQKRIADAYNNTPLKVIQRSAADCLNTAKGYLHTAQEKTTQLWNSVPAIPTSWKENCSAAATMAGGVLTQVQKEASQVVAKANENRVSAASGAVLGYVTGGLVSKAFPTWNKTGYAVKGASALVGAAVAPMFVESKYAVPAAVVAVAAYNVASIKKATSFVVARFLASAE